MQKYARTGPDSDDIVPAETIVSEYGNRGNCIICYCPMYGKHRGDECYMACMPGYTHLYAECKKMDNERVVYDLTHVNLNFLERILSPDTEKTDTPPKGEPREPKELSDPEDKVTLYKSWSLALFERYGFHLYKDFPFSDGKKLVDYLLSSLTMEEYMNMYSLYDVGMRVIAAEPVRYSRHDQWIQYVLRFADTEGPKTFRFHTVYDDINLLDQHIKKLFDENGNKKHDLVYVCADWRYAGSANTPLTPDHWHCCAYCRAPDGGDPGCAFDDAQCMGVYIGQMMNPGHQMRVIRKLTPIIKRNTRRKLR